MMNRHPEVGLVEPRLDLHDKPPITPGRNQSHQGICLVAGVISDLFCLNEYLQPRSVMEHLEGGSQEFGLSISSFPEGGIHYLVHLLIMFIIYEHIEIMNICQLSRPDNQVFPGHIMYIISKCSLLNRGTLTRLYHEIALRVELETLDELCRYLGCQVSDLLEWTE